MTPDSQFNGAPVPPASSGRAMTALVVSLVGFCIPFLLPVGFVLAIMVLMKKGEGQGKATGAIVASIVGFMTWSVVSVLAAIAIPNFIKFQARSKQSECKMNLRASYTAARSYQAERDAVVSSFKDLGFEPERNRRYVYFAGDDTSAIVEADAQNAISVDAARAALGTLTTTGVTGECPACALTIACVGNVDNDDKLDVWSVSTGPRKTSTGVDVSAGEVFHNLDDLMDEVAPQQTLAPTLEEVQPMPDVDPTDVPEPVDPSSITLEDLALMPDAMAALKKLRVKTVPQLLKVKSTQLPRQTYNDIDAALQDFGLTFDENKSQLPQGTPTIQPELAAFVRGKQGEIARCYEQSLKSEPTLAGKLAVHFVIKPNGSVDDVSLEEDTFETPNVGTCVKAVVRRWKTPLHPAEDLEVSYPFVFSPAE